jgi:hypothetical protein
LTVAIDLPMKPTLLSAFLAALAFAACLPPGVDVQPAPTDFAFVEIQLQG